MRAGTNKTDVMELKVSKCIQYQSISYTKLIRHTCSISLSIYNSFSKIQHKL